MKHSKKKFLRKRGTKKKLRKRPLEIMAQKKLSDQFMKSKEGDYFDTKHYDHIVNYDCDCYYMDNGEKKLLFKFRKKVLDPELCQIGIDNLKKAAMKTHDNRGAAAGRINLKKMPKYANTADQLIGRNKFRVLAYKSRYTGKIVKNSFNYIDSNFFS